MASDNSEYQMAWPPACAFPELASGEIHVWLLEKSNTCCISDWRTQFSDDERKRVAAMQSPSAREEFIRGRSALRRILGHYLGRPLEQVPLAYGERGKPELEQQTDLHFNLSNSRGETLIALGRNGALGVDIEGLDREVDLQGIARRYFSAAEVQRLEQSGWNRRRFFETWTCKEACLKAAGHGISIELSGIDTGTVTAATPASVRVVFEAGIQDWFVQLLPEIEGYTAALATADSGLRVKTWRWALSD